MFRMLTVLGAVWLAMALFTLTQRRGEMDPLGWPTLAQLVLGVALLSLGLWARNRRWSLHRTDPEVESVIDRLRTDDAYTTSDAVKELLRARRKIAAIGVYRRATGVGLKDAKEAVEAIEKTLEDPDVHRP